MKDFDVDSRITKQVEVGRGGDITVLQELKVGDEVVWEEEGDSLLTSLIYFLTASASGSFKPLSFLDNYEFLYFLSAVAHDYANGDQDTNIFQRGGGHDESPPWHVISGVSGSSPITVTLNNEIGKMADHGQYDAWSPSLSDVVAVYISGAGGNLDGAHRGADLNVVDSKTLEISATASGSESASGAYAGIAIKGENINFVYPETEYVLGDATFVLGTGSGPNTLYTSALHDMVYNGTNAGELQYNPITRNPPEVNLTEQISTIKLSREVDNQSGGDIQAREIGVVNKIGATADRDEYRGANDTVLTFTCLARDIIDVTIPSGEVISFTYKIRTSSNDNGGIMTNFNEMLYRQLTNSSRTVNDINNNNQTDGPSRNQFNARGNVGYRTNLVGPVVGTGTTVVDEANFDLENRVPYGQGDGELFKIGGYLDSMQIDEGNDRSFVDFVSIFENKGSTTIGINEVGMVTNGPSGPVLIARSLTSQQKDVAPGDTIEVRYRVALNL